jgi:magnesium transporter
MTSLVDHEHVTVHELVSAARRMTPRGQAAIVCRRCDSDPVAEAVPERRTGFTGGDCAVADVPAVSVEDRAADARAALVGRSFTCATDIAALDGERFAGLVPLEVLLSADDETTLAELVVDAAVVAPGDDLETATRTTARHGGRSVAVVDDQGRFHGLVPAERLLLVLELEHEEDIARLGGFMAGASAARSASQEEVRRRLWHRLPWLGLGLLGAMASAVVVGSFEDELRAQVLLAFFIPAVVYMADAVGTQTETVVIRGMALGVPIRAIFVRELVTGLVIGGLLGASFFVFAAAFWGDERVAAAVGISLGVSCSIATVVAMALPYGLDRLGRDPAFGSGPLATVVQDLLSIIVYFAVAMLVVG